MAKNLFIAATGQSDGKTTLTIGLYDFFLRQQLKVGFIKPVGQRYVVVNDEQIDKDSYLIQNVFNTSADIKLTSPIAIPAGYTETYIEHRREKKSYLHDKLKTAYRIIAGDSDVVLLEGTGHAGVGSVLDLSNAKVAAMLGAKAILIAPGGIGNTVDEIMLNKALFDQEGVEIIGIIVNKVYLNKLEKIKQLVTQAMDYYRIPVLGFIPYEETLSSPNMFIIKESLKADILNESDSLFENIENIVVGAMTPHYVLSHLNRGSLLITPGDREDVILAAISLAILQPENPLTGIVLTGGILPKENVYKLLKKTNIPILYVNEGTYETAKKVSKLLVKITIKDKHKIELAKRLITDYVDTDSIMKYIQSDG